MDSTGSIRVKYQAQLPSGEVIDKSDSFEFEPGEDSVIPGFEKAVSDMHIGETRTVKVEPKEAYGARDSGLVQAIAKEHIPPNLKVREGMQLQIGEDTEPFVVTVVEVNDDHIIIDANHPLAGSQIVFTVTRLGSQ